MLQPITPPPTITTCALAGSAVFVIRRAAQAPAMVVSDSAVLPRSPRVIRR